MFYLLTIKVIIITCTENLIKKNGNLVDSQIDQLNKTIVNFIYNIRLNFFVNSEFRIVKTKNAYDASVLQFLFVRSATLVAL